MEKKEYNENPFEEDSTPAQRDRALIDNLIDNNNEQEELLDDSVGFTSESDASPGAAG